MDILAVVRKVILCVGLLVSSLLFLYPHWRGTFEHDTGVFEYDLGRSFITAPPIPEPLQIVRMTGLESSNMNVGDLLQAMNVVQATYRIHRVRQLTEVTLALLFTFGLMWALRKPAEALAKG